MINSSVKNLGEVEYDNQGRIKGVGGPRLVSRRTLRDANLRPRGREAPELNRLGVQGRA